MKEVIKIGADDKRIFMRVGQGFDVHRFSDVQLSDTARRPLILMGCIIPYDRALIGHSDADVMLHAIIDALLGAAGLGDIGQHFSDVDPAYLNVSSVYLLEVVLEKIRLLHFKVINVDVCLIGERPKIAPYRTIMCERIAPLLGIDLTAINVKATTTEQLGFTGRGEGLAAQALVMLERIES